MKGRRAGKEPYKKAYLKKNTTPLLRTGFPALRKTQQHRTEVPLIYTERQSCVTCPKQQVTLEDQRLPRNTARHCPEIYKQQLLWMAVTDFLLILNPNVTK